jgi:hypothetical protein
MAAQRGKTVEEAAGERGKIESKNNAGNCQEGVMR